MGKGKGSLYIVKEIMIKDRRVREEDKKKIKEAKGKEREGKTGKESKRDKEEWDLSGVKGGERVKMKDKKGKKRRK